MTVSEWTEIRNSQLRYMSVIDGALAQWPEWKRHQAKMQAMVGDGAAMFEVDVLEGLRVMHATKMAEHLALQPSDADDTQWPEYPG